MSRTLFMAAMIAVQLFFSGCHKREVPEIAAAAEACGVSYAIAENIFFRANTVRRQPVPIQQFGRCVVFRDAAGRGAIRIVKDAK